MKVDEEGIVLPIEILFPNGNSAWEFVPVPHLEIGQVSTRPTRDILTPVPGQTQLRLRWWDEGGDMLPQYETLFTYHVRTEEQLWLGLFTGSVLILGLFAAWCGALRPRIVTTPVPEVYPQINVNIMLPTPQITEATVPQEPPVAVPPP